MLTLISDIDWFFFYSTLAPKVPRKKIETKGGYKFRDCVRYQTFSFFSFLNEFIQLTSFILCRAKENKEEKVDDLIRIEDEIQHKNGHLSQNNEETIQNVNVLNEDEIIQKENGHLERNENGNGHENSEDNENQSESGQDQDQIKNENGHQSDHEIKNIENNKESNDFNELDQEKKLDNNENISGITPIKQEKTFFVDGIESNSSQDVKDQTESETFILERHIDNQSNLNYTKDSFQKEIEFENQPRVFNIPSIISNSSSSDLQSLSNLQFQDPQQNYLPVSNSTINLTNLNNLPQLLPQQQIEGKEEKEKKKKKKKVGTKKVKELEDPQISQLKEKIREQEKYSEHLQGLYKLSLAEKDVLDKAVENLKFQLMKNEEKNFDEDEDEDFAALFQQKDLLIHQFDEQNQILNKKCRKLEEDLEKQRNLNEDLTKDFKTKISKSNEIIQELEQKILKDQEKQKKSLQQSEAENNNLILEVEKKRENEKKLMMENQELSNSLKQSKIENELQLNQKKEFLQENSNIQLALKQSELTIRNLEQENRRLSEQLSQNNNQVHPKFDDTHTIQNFLTQEKEKEMNLLIDSIKSTADERISLIEESCSRKIRETEERIQMESNLKLSELSANYEEQIMILKRKNTYLEKELSSQLSSMNLSLDQLLEAKIFLEKELNDAKTTIEEKINQNFQLESLISKLKSQRGFFFFFLK